MIVVVHTLGRVLNKEEQNTCSLCKFIESYNSYLKFHDKQCCQSSGQDMTEQVGISTYYNCGIKFCLGLTGPLGLSEFLVTDKITLCVAGANARDVTSQKFLDLHKSSLLNELLINALVEQIIMDFKYT